MRPPDVTTVTTAAPGGICAPRPEGQTDRLIQAAHAILNGVGAEMGPRKVHRTVRTFEERIAGSGFTFFDFMTNTLLLDIKTRRQLLNDPDVMRVVSYSDPTGETAVRSVMRTP